MRRAKIVCTLGPATNSAENLRELVRSGMDVARLNLSHGDHADHERVYHDVRKASDAMGRAVGILVDLQGPKIRTARFENGPIELVRGASFTITTRDVPGNEVEVGTTYAGLPGDVSIGDRILIDDGKLALIATPGNMKQIARERVKLDAKDAEERTAAEAIASRMSGVQVVISTGVWPEPSAGADAPAPACR